MEIHVVDSHTGGEPTRVVIDGGPVLLGPFAQRVGELQARHDGLRTMLVGEPRGSEALVGALLTPPVDPDCAAGVIFFDNAGYLGMCGHGTIGLVVSLAHLGRVHPGTVRIDTPVGAVDAVLHAGGEVSVHNVASYRHRKAVAVAVPGLGEVRGDVAWGGNWFFLVEQHGLPVDLRHLEQLTDVTWRIRQALTQQGIRGADGGEIDHIELFAPGVAPGAHSRNFVLCPGKAYDRSPCGTGTSAKLACLAADGKLKEGEEWVQESVVGSVFRGRFRQQGDRIQPTITGTAHVCAESVLLLDERDPFCWGIRG